MQTIIPISIPQDSEATPTPSQLSQVRLMANLGVRPIVTAILFDISLCDLSRACAAELSAGIEDSHKAVLANLKRMALSKRHPSATIFWVKTFCAHLLPSTKPAEPDPYPDPPFELVVYNNDGEPNAVY